MDHDEMLELFDAIETATLADLPGILEKHAPRIELAGTPAPARLLHGDGERDEHVLLVVALDASGVLAFEVIPVALIDDRLRVALELVNGRVFAGAADLREDQWDAAVLVMAAEAAEMPTAAEHHEWAVAEGTRVTLPEIEQVWNRWTGTGVSSWSDLERRVTAVYTYRRAT